MTGPLAPARGTAATTTSEWQLPAALIAQEFPAARGYLNASSVGLMAHSTRAAMIDDLDRGCLAHPDISRYTTIVENTRETYAGLVGVSPERVAIGSQTSAFVALIAASLPAGAEVLVPECEFASLAAPFAHAPQGLTVRTAPLADLAARIDDETALVAFSLVQSCDGAVADTDAVTAAARAHGARTLCDTTQAVGWLPVDAGPFDATICHAYKWLGAPRGVAFLTVSEEFAPRIPPLFAGWYSAADPWTSLYGHEHPLADSARRFDLSPAWQAFVGAEAALHLAAGLDQGAVHDHTTTMAATFRARLDLPEPTIPSAIVSWDDPTGGDLARLRAAGITASGRAGRARAAFHLYNTAADVDAAARALGR